MARAHSVAQVLLDTSLPQLDHLFDYRVPEEFQSRVRVGQRVKVPLRSGSRGAFGYVIALGSTTKFAGELSPLLDIVSEIPILQPEIAKLARSLADRAAGSASDIIRLAIPPRHIRAEKAFLLRVAGSELMPESNAVGLRQAKADVRRVAIDASPFPRRLSTGEWSPGWTGDICEAAQVYLDRGESVVVAVPDLTDLSVAMDALLASGVLEDSVVRLDAHQSKAQRYDSFLRALEPKPRVLLGNRSVVYAPAHNLGAMMFWDDGDSLFEEPLAPYVHARDAALLRAEQQQSDLFFFSYSRSLDVHRLVRLGYVRDLQQSARGARRVLDTESDQQSRHRIPDTTLGLIRKGLEQGPVLIQVASPGSALVLFCADCGERQLCAECSSPLRSTEREGLTELVCRGCSRRVADARCASCGSSELTGFGSGSERTVEQLARQFPQVPVLRSDGQNRRTLVTSQPCLVVSTRGSEPLAATGYTCVVLLDAERVLALPMLSAEEEAMRHWVNAAALARPKGVVVLPHVTGRLAEAFALSKYTAWADALLEERVTLRFPPAVRVASVSGPRRDVMAALAVLDGLSDVDWVEQKSAPGKESFGAVVRFSYAAGADVAKRLRAYLVTSATLNRSGRQKTAQSRTSRFHLHFDDRGAFDFSE